MSEPLGILPIDKAEGPTSHDVVSAARRALGTRRIGHTGTLDPFASGLLLLCVGRATRLARFLGTLGKTYIARMRLGVATDTDDSTGTAVAQSEDWVRATESDVGRALARQVGDIEQVPPAYSAKKIAGERAYRLARAGRATDLAPVPVRIESIRLTRFAPPDVDFEITCGSGTYIRSVARDAGLELGVGAHLSRLRRTRIGHFAVEDALPQDRLPDRDAVARAWVEPIDALRHLPRLELAAGEAAVIARGGTLPLPASLEGEGAIALVAAGRLVAVGEARGQRCQPRMVLA